MSTSTSPGKASPGGRARGSAAWWTQAKAVAEPGSEFAQDLERSIEAAREHPGGTAQPLSPGKG
ncbi:MULTISPECIES: hypothetical protein [Ramlibacter]|uniref:hypothetical protein n=1 Tax=Ramlibacter TaxID=174951 RepID=UPI001D118962|nr:MULTISPECIES: hypothetical protein [Ramlibacter]